MKAAPASARAPPSPLALGVLLQLVLLLNNPDPGGGGMPGSCGALGGSCAPQPRPALFQELGGGQDPVALSAGGWDLTAGRVVMLHVPQWGGTDCAVTMQRTDSRHLVGCLNNVGVL